MRECRRSTIALPQRYRNADEESAQEFASEERIYRAFVQFELMIRSALQMRGAEDEYASIAAVRLFERRIFLNFSLKEYDISFHFRGGDSFTLLFR